MSSAVTARWNSTSQGRRAADGPRAMELKLEVLSTVANEHQLEAFAVYFADRLKAEGLLVDLYFSRSTTLKLKWLNLNIILLFSLS